jgi:integrase
MAGSRGTVRHLCRDRNGRALKRPRSEHTQEVAKHAPNCKQRDRGWAYGIRLTPDRYLRRAGFTSERQATEAMEEARKQFAQGIDPTVRPPTVSEWLDDYLALRRYTRRKQPIRPQSHALLRGWASHIRRHLGHLRLDALRLVDIERMFDAIREANQHAERPIGLATQNQVLTLLRSSLDEAVRQGKLVRNPVGNFGVEPYEAPEKKVWTTAQRDAFLDAAVGNLLAVAFELVLLYGLRRNEVLGLRWQDIEDGRLHVRQQLGGGTPQTKGSRRGFHLDPGTLASLRDHRRRQLEDRLRASSAWRDNDLVIARPDGSPVTPKQLAREWLRVVKQADVPYISLHDGRHTAATLVLAAGGNLKTVSKMLGHASTRITADLYQHVLDEHELAAAELIGSLRTRRTEVSS